MKKISALPSGDFAVDGPFFTRSFCLDVYRRLFFARLLDQKMNVLVKQNKGTTFTLSTAGHEMVGTLFGMLLTSKKDWAFPYYRDRCFALSLGISPTEILAAFLARNTPHHSSGRMMLDHFSDPEFRIPCQSSVVASQYLHAVGRALAVKLGGQDEVVYVSGGDGSTSQGEFHEALNFASLHELPVIFCIQDNGYAISTVSSEQTAGGSIASIARGFLGLEVFEVDGCDYEQMIPVIMQAVERGRKKKGPSIVIAKVPRLGPHSCSDDPKKYKTPEIIESEKKRDPLPRFQNWIIDRGLATLEELEAIQNSLPEEIESLVREAERVPFPAKETATSHVFKEHVFEEKQEEKNFAVMMDGIHGAIREAMEKDPSIIVFGEDVAREKGGVFGITRNLTKDFGPRCFNTPLAEATIVGVAIGLSFHGYKPIIEIQFSDYAWPAMSQIVCELASMHYRSNGEWNCPVVLRMTTGGYIQGGPYHSQSIEAVFCHMPGLKVVIPSHPMDAYRLMRMSIEDPNPVIFLEHKALYRQPISYPYSPSFLPLGKAAVLREGKDLTLIGYGFIIPMAYEVAEMVSKEGISVEIIDLRCVHPLDMETVLSSVKKTGKVLIVHEAVQNCGLGAEISARIMEEAFCYLDAPVTRLTGKDCPIPYCKDLEEAVLPQKKDLLEAVRKLYAF